MEELDNEPLRTDRISEKPSELEKDANPQEKIRELISQGVCDTFTAWKLMMGNQHLETPRGAPKRIKTFREFMKAPSTLSPFGFMPYGYPQ